MTRRPWVDHYDLGVPEQPDIPDISIDSLLAGTALRFPQKSCTIYEGKKISYQKMNTLVNQFASWLVRAGVQKGDRVGLYLPNCPEFVMAFYAILRSGGVVVAGNPNQKAPEVRWQLDYTRPKIVIAQESAVEIRSIVSEQIDTLLIMVDGKALPEIPLTSQSFVNDTRENDSIPGPIKTIFLEEILKENLSAQLPIILPDDPAILQFSGGTTGVPKAAVGLHRNLVANTIQFCSWLVGLQPGMVTSMLAIPLYHVYGMVVGMTVSTWLGASMVLISNPKNLEDMLWQLQTYQVSFFPGVPTLFHQIGHHPDVQAGKVDLTAIRACISGSAPLLRETRLRFERLTGAKLMEGYGLSEAPTATHCNPMLGEKRDGSIGLPLPGVDCKIVSLADGSDSVPLGEMGELIIRGPQVMKEYFEHPEETAVVLRDGWLYTGDIAWMDADGYFYLSGRKKDLIKVSGLQVFPKEIEDVLIQHPAVMEVCAAGVPDEVRGERVKVWIVCKQGMEITLEQVRDWCEPALSAYKIPLELELVQALPKTPVGKVLRRELIRRHLEH